MSSHRRRLQVRGERTPRELKARFVDSDPAVEAALAAGLRYVSDKQPGIRRERRSDGFVYIGANNQPVEDERALARITSLAIPPARTTVWICATVRGHIQAALLHELAHEEGIGVLVATHDQAVVAVADRVIQIRDGGVIEGEAG